MVDCNSGGSDSFVCGGKSYSRNASSVYDKSGTNWDIVWTYMGVVNNCSQISDGTFVEVKDQTYRGSVINAGISAEQLLRLETRYRVIRPNF